MRRRWRRTASGTVLALVVGTLVVLAFKYDGKPFTEVELNDGGVWVTNHQLGLTARLNPQIEELDLGVEAASTDFDIFQRATSVYVDDAAGERTVKPVDVTRATTLEPTELPADAVVAHGGKTFAVVDHVKGKAWVQSASRFNAFSEKTAKPVMTGAVTATVSPDGRAWVLDREGRATPFDVGSDGNASKGEAIDLGEDVGTNPLMLELTVVDDTPVLFNRTTVELTRPGAEAVAVEAADPTEVELQEPSAEGDEVYVATREGLFRTPLDGGDLDRVGDLQPSGSPAAPVVLPSTGCVYAAWSSVSPPNYLRDCPNDEDDDTDPISDMQEGAELRFRVNRNVVVLNDVRTGDAWLVQQPGKAKIDNWPQVDPQNENRSKIKKTTEETPDQENRPPEPVDDELGARPGRSTVLPVVAMNDHDPDGDIIRIVKTEHLAGPELEVKIVGGGTQLQVAVPSDASGESQFYYYVTDGRVNQQVRARVTLQIRDSNQNEKPGLMEDRKPELTVARGATASMYLLADFYDMDGDDLTLTEATARGGEVEFRPDGTLTYTDDGAAGSTGEVKYVIEDGIDVYRGSLPVKVVAEGAPPELVADLASGVADTQVVVQPLANDRNPEGGELALKDVKVVGDDAGTQISKDLDSGTFTFQAATAKTYYLEYSAYNSTATKSAFIRLDIESPPKDNRPPVAVRDKVTVTGGATAQVDLLLNDLDPDGDVLVVTRIGRPSVPGVKVSVVEKRLAVVSAVTDLVGKPVTVEYVVSDGRSSATGTLVIAQRSSSDANRHPIANKDQVTVRAGAVTSIPVLANDSDPDGGKPRLFQSDLEKGDVDVWVAGDALRMRAPEEPGTYSVIYGVRDNDGLKASAEVSIYVVPDSAKNNNKPVPQPIIDRVIGGRPKVIPIDLVGADPDGDAVSFRSILTAPSLGRVVDTGVDWIRYEAFEGKRGTDFFQIQVQDKYGGTGVAEVRVGVVPEEPQNQPPVALDDSVLVQPNRTISYNVLTNDVDPDDDPLRIRELNDSTPAEHENGFVEVEVGKAPDSGASVPTNIGYTIEDAAGATDSAVLKVSASTQAPFYPPIAHDDVADLGDIIGKEPGDWVEVSVTDNDLDFDGAKVDLRVTDCDAGSGGDCDVDDESVVRVKLAAEDQIVLYTLDDADDESTSTYGVVFVTGTDNVPPQLTTNEDLVPVEVPADQRTVFDLRDLVVTRAGREVHITPDSNPTAVNGSVTPVEGEETSLAFRPAKGHVGPASVTVKVTDGRTTAEDAALESLLTVPIDVKPSGNVAPTMRDAAVDVTAEGDPAEVDLEGLTRDANEDDLESMTWSVTSTPDGLSTDIDDSILSIEAGRGAEDGESLDIGVTADDGNGGQVSATITARIVGSNLPTLQIPDISVNAEEGEATAVDLSASAVNPYPDKPIEASNPRVEGDGRLADVRTEGSTVWFTPTSSGTSQISVTVSDASGDRARDVVARINVTVISEPDAPDRPVLSSVEASSAVLSWREPDANGAAITEYEVSGSNGYRKTCTVTTCRLDGLTPGQAYRFTVKARNSEGWSKASPESDEIVPNKAPELMTPPTIVTERAPTGDKMDRQLKLTWTPPKNEGSPITSYEIKEAGSTRTWTASGSASSYIIPGLTNGTPYAFEIRAVNAVEPKREFSAPSKPVVPFGAPLRSGQAPKLTASEDSPFNSEPWVRIEWSAWSESQSNGNPVSRYVLRCQGCSQSTYEVDGSTTSRTFDGKDGIRKGHTVTFTVAAKNDAGTSQPSPSASGRPWTKAAPVRNLREIGSSPEDRTAKIGWEAPADDGGLPISHYVVEPLSGGPTMTVGSAPGAGGVNVRFSANSTSHSVRVWAVTRNGDRNVQGQDATVNGIATWGKPFPPTARNVSNWYYTIDLRIDEGGANGRSVEGVRYSLTGPDGPWTDGDRYYDDQVNQGGDSVTVWAQTVSSASQDRRFSDVVSFTASSKMREMTLRWKAPCIIGACGAEVKVEGFPAAGAPITVDPGALGYTAENCDFNQVVSGHNKTFRVGGSSCSFTPPGTLTVGSPGLSNVSISRN
ncbi:Ig-like domain-containing protein [Nocardioides sp. J54]|uniref:Ig-like domain-containing protein n=1 Tax=Nocardioides sp. J54 TaxID=935866 RepID=UPI0004ACB2FE|nr:Ig-like domain-containing protein [Nocardioides sp. J54]